ETGCGIIPLAGAVIEVFSNNTNNYTIRITTATTTSVSGALTNAEFIYVSNGTSYSPGWRRAYNTKNKPTAADVGALPLSGGALTGGLTAAGEIISKSANGLRIAYGNYGFFIRNDGSSTCFMLTDSGNSLGTYNRLRPLIINNANGAVTIGNGLNVTGGINGSLNGNAATATKLQTARTIGGVSFDGSANINLPGVNTTGNQNTTGNAATATKLQTARNINGVPFDGTKDITLTPKDLDAYSKSEVQSALAGKQPLDNTLTNLSGKDVAGLLAYLQLGEAAKRNVGTGNNQLPDMSAFGMSRNGQTAWDILPNGMIRQVGTVTLTPVGNFNSQVLGGVTYYTHYYRVNFPRQFPNAQIATLATLASYSFSTQSSMAGKSLATHRDTDSGTDVSRTRFTVSYTTPNLGEIPTLHFEAIGY
ncbi:gp53-like domain-containing protein, partial [Escherichia coli]